MKQNKHRCRTCGHIKEKHTIQNLEGDGYCKVGKCKCKKFIDTLEEENESG